MSYIQLPPNMQFSGEIERIALDPGDAPIQLDLGSLSGSPSAALLTNFAASEARIYFWGDFSSDIFYKLAPNESVIVPNAAMLKLLYVGAANTVVTLVNIQYLIPL